MILVLKNGASESDAQRLMQRIEHQGLRPLYLPGVERVVLGAVGDDRQLVDLCLDQDPAVESVKLILTPYKLVSREFRGHDTVVNIAGLSLGGERISVVVRPRHTESVHAFRQVTEAVSAAGARALQGTPQQDTTVPYDSKRAESHKVSSQALEELYAIARSSGLAMIRSLMDTSELDAALAQADCLNVDGYGMHNRELLTALGKAGVPVILSRSPSATREELLLAAERIVGCGNPQVVLCESGTRGVGTKDSALDLGSVVFLKTRSHLPVVVDLFRCAESKDALLPMAQAAITCGADGLMIQVDAEPCSNSGRNQERFGSARFARLLGELRPAAAAVGRQL